MPCLVFWQGSSSEVCMGPPIVSNYWYSSSVTSGSYVPARPPADIYGFYVLPTPSFIAVGGGYNVGSGSNHNYEYSYKYKCNLWIGTRLADNISGVATIHDVVGINDYTLSRLYGGLPNRNLGGLAVGRSYAAAASLRRNTRFSVVGGYDANNQIVGTHEVFTSFSSSSYFAASLTIPRANHAAANLGNDIFGVFGGTTSTLSATNITEVYDGNNNTWSYKASMPIANSGIDAVNITSDPNSLGRVLVVVPNSTTVYVYNFGSNSWGTVAPMPVSSNYVRSTAVYEAGYVFVFMAPNNPVSFGITNVYTYL